MGLARTRPWAALCVPLLVRWFVPSRLSICAIFRHIASLLASHYVWICMCITLFINYTVYNDIMILLLYIVIRSQVVPSRRPDSSLGLRQVGDRVHALPGYFNIY